jgi:hypothetical protein
LVALDAGERSVAQLDHIRLAVARRSEVDDKTLSLNLLALQNALGIDPKHHHRLGNVLKLLGAHLLDMQ